MAMFNISEVRINISIGEGVTDENRHGVLWLRRNENNPKENNLRIPFIFDRPERARKGLNYWTHRRLVHQIKKIGLNASHLEIKLGDKHYCYRTDEYREIYANNGDGRPMYRAAAC